MGDCEKGTINSTTKMKKIKPNSKRQTSESRNVYATKMLSLIRRKAYVLEPFITCYALSGKFLSNTLPEHKMFQIICTMRGLSGCTTSIKHSSVYNVSEPMLTGISIITCVFLAAWSDRTGNRRALLIIPVLGKMVSLCGFLLAVFFSHWPVWVVKIIYCLPKAMCGRHYVMYVGCYSYLTDVIKSKSRAARLGVIILFFLRTDYFFNRLIDFFEKSTASLGVYAIILSLQVLALILAFIGIEDVRKTQVKGTWYSRILQFVHPRNVWDTMSLVITTRGHQFYVTVLLILCIVIDVFVTAEADDVLNKKREAVMQLSKSENLQYKSVQLMASVVGVMVTNRIFIKKMQLHDSVLGIIGLSCQITSRIYFGLVTNLFWHYLGAVINVFPVLARIVSYSLASNVAGPDKIAKLYCLMFVARAIFEFILFETVYSSQFYEIVVSSFHSGTLVCCGFLSSSEIFIFIALYILFKKIENSEKKNSVTEENYEVTVL